MCSSGGFLKGKIPASQRDIFRSELSTLVSYNNSLLYTMKNIGLKIIVRSLKKCWWWGLKSLFNECYQASRRVGRKISLDLYFILCIEISFRWVKELNINQSIKDKNLWKNGMPNLIQLWRRNTSLNLEKYRLWPEMQCIWSNLWGQTKICI